MSPGLAGWSFALKAGDVTLRTMTTEADGTVTTTLSDGMYTIVETQQASWTSTDPGGATPSKSVQIIGSGSAMVVLFGNAPVVIQGTATLPSTSTDGGTSGTLPAVLLALAILTATALGAFRYWMR